MSLGVAAAWVALAPADPSERKTAFGAILDDGRVAEAHDALWAAVRSGRPVDPPRALPADYAHAFDQVWAAPRADSVAERWGAADPALLVVLPDHGRGRVSVSFNADQSAGFLDRRRRDAARSPGRWLVTAAYTSSLVWPAGVFVHEGRVRNAAPQSWDGVVVVGRDRSVRVLDASALRLGSRRLDLAATPEAWTDVLRAAEASGLTLFQQHLVVRRGRSAVSDNASEARAVRRALFETPAGTAAVYDSTPDALTLAALAARLVNDYGALRAVNLDTGTYSVAELHRDGHPPRSRSTLGSGVVLTSLLEIDAAAPPAVP
ncbi:MAG: hypothetical protein AAGI91_15335 [Bacteroidota bacterium]